MNTETQSIINIGESFEKLNDTSKAWVYTAVKPLSQEDVKQIQEIATVFLSQWESHGKKVVGNIQIIDNRFIAVFADPQDDTMCGRAQDASVRLIKELEEVLGNSLMDRMMVAYEANNGIEVIHFNDLKDKIAKGEVSESQYFYNSLINSIREFKTNWRRPINGSWLV